MIRDGPFLCKIGDFGLSRFGFIVRTDRHTSQTELKAGHSIECITHAGRAAPSR